MVMDSLSGGEYSGHCDGVTPKPDISCGSHAPCIPEGTGPRHEVHRGSCQGGRAVKTGTITENEMQVSNVIPMKGFDPAQGVGLLVGGGKRKDLLCFFFRRHISLSPFDRKLQCRRLSDSFVWRIHRYAGWTATDRTHDSHGTDSADQPHPARRTRDFSVFYPAGSCHQSHIRRQSSDGISNRNGSRNTGSRTLH